MTAEERIEQLLNRAGQTLVDIPEYKIEDGFTIRREAMKAIKDSGEGFNIASLATYFEQELYRDTEIIDRLETALSNTLLKLEGGDTNGD